MAQRQSYKPSLTVTLTPGIRKKLEIEARDKYPQREGSGNRSRVVEDALVMYFQAKEGNLPEQRPPSTKTMLLRELANTYEKTGQPHEALKCRKQALAEEGIEFEYY